MLNTLRLQTQLRLSKEILGTRGLGGIEMPAGKKWHPLTRDLLDGDWGTPGGMGIDLLQKGQTPSIAIVKKKTPVERVEMSMEMKRRVTHEVREYLRRRMPDASDAELNAALAESMLTESIPGEIDVEAIERAVVLESANC